MHGIIFLVWWFIKFNYLIYIHVYIHTFDIQFALSSIKNKNRYEIYHPIDIDIRSICQIKRIRTWTYSYPIHIWSTSNVILSSYTNSFRDGLHIQPPFHQSLCIPWFLYCSNVYTHDTANHFSFSSSFNNWKHLVGGWDDMFKPWD